MTRFNYPFQSGTFNTSINYYIPKTVIFHKSIFSRFDWKSPIRYSIASISEWISFTNNSFVFLVITTFGIACYLFIVALNEDNKSILQTINTDARAKATRLNIYKQFTEFVDSHSDTKQLSPPNFLFHEIYGS